MLRKIHVICAICGRIRSTLAGYNCVLDLIQPRARKLWLIISQRQYARFIDSGIHFLDVYTVAGQIHDLNLYFHLPAYALD